MKYVVVIPCRNEALTIHALVREAKQYSDLVIVVNDSSTDDTARVATAAGAFVVDVPKQRRGLAGVYEYGDRVALTKVPTAHVCEMDAGGSHDPTSLPTFWRTLDEGADIAAGCRFGRIGAEYHGNWKRYLLSKGGTIATNLVRGTNFRDATSGFVAYRASALHQLLSTPWASAGHFYQTEMRLRARDIGLRVIDVPIVYRSSSTSLNGASIREALRVLWNGE